MKTRKENLEHYATAKRITTGVIHQVVNGELVRFHVGKLRGKIVGSQTNYKFETKEEAYQCAHDFAMIVYLMMQESANETQS